jgi:hypothetical protein
LRGVLVPAVGQLLGPGQQFGGGAVVDRHHRGQRDAQSDQPVRIPVSPELEPAPQLVRIELTDIGR